MATPTIVQRAPFVIQEAAGTKWWCACGMSQTQPYCDGAHKGSGITPLKVEVAQPGTVAWCGCKHSKNGAFCDGSHRTV